MIDFAAFSDELTKIAKAQKGYRVIRAQNVLIQSGIPLIRKLPEDPEEAKRKIHKALRRRDVRSVLGYPNVAVKVKDVDPKAMGLKKTRMAVPLPGEGWFTPTWRSGKLHMHKIGPLYLVHKDKDAPMGEKGGYVNWKAIKHVVTEGAPSVWRRYAKKLDAPIKQVE